MTQTRDLIKKMADFFTGEEFYEKGEDARLELTPDDVRCMNEVIKACGNAVSRQVVKEQMIKYGFHAPDMTVTEFVEDLPPVRPQDPKWIPVSKRLPRDLEPVNITWVNHNPESYYTDIKDKPFTATGHYCNGRWWWYSVTCQDYLEEYGRCDVDAMDDDIEVIAWMPLPKPFDPQEDKEKEE